MSGCDSLQIAGNHNGFLPVFFLFVDFQQKLECGFGVLRVFEFEKQFFGAIEQTGLEVILRELIHGHGLLIFAQIGARHQILVHADGALDFTTAPEQAAQREVQFDGLRIHLDHFDEGFNRLVRLLIQQEVKPLEIRRRQRTRLGQQMTNINARRDPTQRKKQRQCQQPPGFNFHCRSPALYHVRHRIRGRQGRGGFHSRRSRRAWHRRAGGLGDADFLAQA